MHAMTEEVIASTTQSTGAVFKEIAKNSSFCDLFTTAGKTHTCIAATIGLAGVLVVGKYWYDAKEHRAKKSRKLNARIIMVCDEISRLNVGERISSALKEKLDFVIPYAEKTFDSPEYSKLHWASGYISNSLKAYFRPIHATHTANLKAFLLNTPTITQQIKDAAEALGDGFVSSAG